MRSVEMGVEAPVGPPWPNFMDRFRDAYVAEMEAFVMVARGQAISECTAHDGVEALRVAEAATLSMERGTPVSLIDVPSNPSR